MRVVLLGGAPGIGKTTTARRLMELAQAGPDLVQWVDVDALWFHRPWRVDERTKAMVHANIRAVADHAAQAGVDVLLITWVFHTADLHRLVAGLLPPDSEITSVQLHAGHEVWTRRYMGDPERGGGPLAHHEEGYTKTHAVPVDHVVKTDGLTPIEVADAVALAIGGGLGNRVDQTFLPAIDPEQQKTLDDFKNGQNLRH
jgi:chloramphenicol 3-O-phosphotransferase